MDELRQRLDRAIEARTRREATLRWQLPDGSWSDPIPVRDVTFLLNEEPGQDDPP